jgi:hypothetical protein
MRALFVACAVAFAAGIGGAQQPGSSQAAARFEVVSVKPAAPPVSIQGFNFTRPPQDHWQVGNLTLEEISRPTIRSMRFPA